MNCHFPAQHEQDTRRADVVTDLPTLQVSVLLSQTIQAHPSSMACFLKGTITPVPAPNTVTTRESESRFHTESGVPTTLVAKTLPMQMGTENRSALQRLRVPR